MDYHQFSLRTVLLGLGLSVLAANTATAEDSNNFIPASPLSGGYALQDGSIGETRPQWVRADGVNLEGSATTTTAPVTQPLLPTTKAATQPESTSAEQGNFPVIGGAFGLTEFFEHFALYEPMYFVGGWRAPQVKFQFSIRYRFITPNGPIATKIPLLAGFNFAYSQTSLWDWTNSENPFFYDSSYRPEGFYYLQDVPFLTLPKTWQLGLQAGVGHESNGLKDPNHRSLNIFFLRPILSIGDAKSGLFLAFAPKFYDYFGSLSLNPDMPRYRGYCDIRVVVGQRDGLQLATIGRVGSHWDRGSAQIDLTYPLTKITGGNADLSLDAQYFIGYGDTLLSYNRSSNIVRFGLALVR